MSTSKKLSDSAVDDGMKKNDGRKTRDTKNMSNSKESLDTLEKRNLAALVFAYACTMSCVTMVVGNSAVVVKSVGGGNTLAPFALGAYFWGAALVSIITSPLFVRCGRKGGFLIGNASGLLGAGLGAVAILIKSPALVIACSVPLGTAMGIGMHIRFAAVEVVRPFARASAVTLVLTGGVISAFAGPESARAAKDMFGDKYPFLGLFLVVAIFNVINALIVSLVKFRTKDRQTEALQQQEKDMSLRQVLLRREFAVPMFISALSWSTMIMPMSIVRIAMGEAAFSSRESLLVIELHFLGMYSPGFVTGKIIDRKGAFFTSCVAVIFFATSIVTSSVSNTKAEGTIATWILGLVLIGIGWNFGFSSSTVWLGKVYALAPQYKTRIQAANDCVMFLLTGSVLFSTGYIYEAAGSALSGWRAVNYSAAVLAAVIASVLGFDFFCERRKEEELDTEKEMQASEESSSMEERV